MAPNLYKVTPVLKVCEWSTDQGGGSYLGFEEDLGVPGVDDYSIRMEFKNANTLDEIEKIKKYLKDKGLILVFSRTN